MYRKTITFLLSLFLAVAIAIPVDATWRENPTFTNLTVTKTARINGLLQAVANTTGNVWYVHSGTGIDGVGAAGKSQLTPFATGDYAVSRCKANNNDYIIMMAGHAESGTDADLLDLNVAGVTVLGLGDGTDMPEFTYADTDVTVAIGAANVSIYNIRFVAGISAIVIGVAVEDAGDNFLMSDCYFPEPSTSTFEFIDAIDLESGVDDFTIQNTEYFNADDTGGSHFIEAGNGVNNRMKILNCHIVGEFLVSAIWSDTIDLEVLIDDCVIENLTNAQHAIEFTDAALGLIRNTSAQTDAIGTSIDPGSLDLDNVQFCDNSTPDTSCIPLVASAGGAASADLAAIHLDHLMALDGATQAYPEQAVSDSTICKMLGDDDPAVCTTYDNSRDSLEALGRKTDKIDAAALATAPVANSLAAFIASGGTGLGAELGDSMSLIDVLGNNGLGTTRTGDLDAADLQSRIDAISAAMGIVAAAGADGFEEDGTGGDLYDMLCSTDTNTNFFSGDGNTNWDDNLFSLLKIMSTYIVDGDGDFATGTALASDKSLVDALGTDGTTPADTATSVLGAIGVNDANNTMDTSAVVTNDDGSVFERLEGLLDLQEKSVSGSTAVMVNADTIFTIAGGPIKVIDLVSICISGNDGTASTLQYSADPTVGAAITFSGACASLAAFAAGGGVVLNQTGLATAPDLSVVMVGLGSVSTNKIIINEGIITVVIGVGSTTGTWKHYLRYIPLAAGVTVTGT